MIYGKWNTLRSAEEMGELGLSRKSDTVDANGVDFYALPPSHFVPAEIG
jgi:hypothetical protein